MSRGPSTTERLAACVAEGRSVDWERELAAHPGERRQIENLRGLAALAAGANTAAGETDGAPLGSWGHLRLVAELGSGSFGTVYRAFDPVLQREVALKLRRPRPAEGGAAARAFIAEARRLARVRHPNVLGVYGADVHDGRAGLWAELLDAATLEHRVASDGRFETARVVEIGEALASALAAVHAAGLTHGDVKASNVAVDGDERVVLVDFGAGSDLRAGERQPVRFGSPLTAAPERLAGEPPSAAADVYGLGVLLYRLLSGGRYPVEAESWEELLAVHRGSSAATAAARLRGAPRALRRLLAELLAARPAARPAADRVAERLRWIAATPGRRRRRAAVAAVIASLALGTFASGVGWVRARRAAEVARAARAETEAINSFLTEMLAAPRAGSSGRQVRVIDVLADAAGRLGELGDGSAAQARVQLVLGGTYMALDQPAAAEPLLAPAAATFAEREGEAAPAALEARAFWAEALLERGEVDAARRLAGEVIAAGAGRPPAVGPVFAQVLLARIDAEAGRHREAERRLRATLEALPPEGKGLARVGFLAEMGLASTLLEMGRFDEARSRLEGVVEHLRRTEGMRHGDTLTASNNLAVALSGLGRFDEAAAALREVATTAGEWLGEGDGYTLRVRSNLAAALKEAGHIREGYEIEAEILPRFERVFGADSPPALQFRVNHCLTRRQVGELAAAERCSEELAGRLAEVLGDSNPVTLIHAVNHAELFLDSGRPRRALELARETRARMAASFGDESPYTLAADTLVGAALAATGERQAGIDLLRRTLDEQRRVTGPAELQALTTQLRLARAVREAGDRDRAVALGEEALALARAAYAPAHPLIGELEAELSSTRVR